MRKMEPKAELTFKHGVMGSGKSRDLISFVYDCNERDINVMVMKSQIDNRSGSLIKSRDNTFIEPDRLINQTDNIYEIVTNYLLDHLVDYIVIDEVQFLKREQIIQLSNIVCLLNIPVICYGLSSDFQDRLFEGSEALFAFADKCEVLTTFCSYCGDTATRNVRFDVNTGEIIVEGNQIVIGDSCYKPLCGRCKNKLVRKLQKKD